MYNVDTSFMFFFHSCSLKSSMGPTKSANNKSRSSNAAKQSHITGDILDQRSDIESACVRAGVRACGRACLRACVRIPLSSYLSIYLSGCLSACLPYCLSNYIYLPTTAPAYLTIYHPICLST